MERGYLGIDVGSTSVKCVILDEQSKIIDSVYLRNRGIMESVPDCLSRLENGVEIAACGITGSGRNFTDMLIGGDLVKTEVLAHSVAALACYPEVRTIFEIGGEDCKLMPPYVFQGATAQNKALVKALEEELNHPVIVPDKWDKIDFAYQKRQRSLRL